MDFVLVRRHFAAQHTEPLQQGRVVALRFGTQLGDAYDDGAQAIQRRQQGVGFVLVHVEHAVAHFGEQRLTCVRDFFEPLERKETAAAFERVHGPKNAAHEFFVMGFALEPDQINFELVKKLLRFEQKFVEDFFVVVHTGSLVHSRHDLNACVQR